MASRNFVYSTLSTNMTYTTYSKGVNDLPNVEHKVFIAGGANVANNHMITPRGVVTEVSDSDLEHLLDNELFKRHMDNGFILVDTVQVDPEVKAADMEHADDSAPLTPEDYMDTKGAKPTKETKVSKFAKNALKE